MQAVHLVGAILDTASLLPRGSVRFWIESRFKAPTEEVRDPIMDRVRAHVAAELDDLQPRE